MTPLSPGTLVVDASDICLVLSKFRPDYVVERYTEIVRRHRLMQDYAIITNDLCQRDVVIYE